MAVLTRSQVIGLAQAVGIPRDELAIAGAICEAESGRRTDALGINPGTRYDPGSRDRGLWQINDLYHPDVSDACAFDPMCNAQAMARISSGGLNWRPWSTYTNGAFRQFLAAYQGITGTGLTVPPPVYDPVNDLATMIRQGRPLFQAVMLEAERIFDRVRASAFNDHAGGTDLGSKWYR